MSGSDSYTQRSTGGADRYSVSGPGYSTYGSGELSHPSRLNPEASLPYPKRPRQNSDSESPSYVPNGYDERDMRYVLAVNIVAGQGAVQLFVDKQDADGNDLGPVDPQTLQNPFFVLHVTLWSAEMDEERNIISNPPKCTRVLMGSLVSSPSLLKNPEGQQGLYFAFPDLSIRTEGRYTLKFSLIKLTSNDFITDAKANVIAQVFSDPFTVYSAKKFPGMTGKLQYPTFDHIRWRGRWLTKIKISIYYLNLESTELSKAFARQGLKIPIRNDDLYKDEALDVPEGVTVNIKSRIINVKGPRGELTKNLRHLNMEIKFVEGNKLKFVVYHGNRKHVACIRTVKSIVHNMIVGVTKGFEYKMRYVYAHFPINVIIDDDSKGVEIRNFLGQKVSFRVNMLEGVTVSNSPNQKDELVLTGNDLEAVSQSGKFKEPRVREATEDILTFIYLHLAASIQQTTSVKNKDIRKFLDGIYVSERNIIEAEA
ncbi:hypothetical protein INT43_008055 [Umbelopsis isabellina]|uniref:Velvet domain-containing protein n=1 Tax=Mortierella isabellina TaxID=91625 RepID=A0A8H7PD20_MORIS|nr:hypothetical protein INT43_008055 [Umbelopsis isabellina]